MADAPLVSIVLPTFDRLPYLREAVGSVLAQTFGDWELLVVDDGSTDGTAEWVRGLGDTRVRLLERAHTGRIPALRNAGLAAARGRYVAFVDSDDAWRPDKLERQVAAHREHPGVRWSYSGRTVVDGDGAVIPDGKLAPWRPVSGAIARRLLVHEAMVALPSVMAERGLLEEVGGFDEGLRFATDYDLWLRLALRAECVAIPEPLVRIRLHPGNTTRDRPEVNASFMEVYRKFARLDPDPAVRRVCRRQQAFYAVHLARQRARRGERAAALRALLFALSRDPRSRLAYAGLLQLVLPARSRASPG